jgi:hypothetical protein
METLRLSYDDIMSIPLSRRYRLILKKSDLENERQRRAQEEQSKARSQMRRR